MITCMKNWLKFNLKAIRKQARLANCAQSSREKVFSKQSYRLSRYHYLVWCRLFLAWLGFDIFVVLSGWAWYNKHT